MTPKRFLIATDNEERGKALESLAGRLGAKVSRAQSEEAAMAELSRHAHAAVFLDADSRVLPGLPFCSRLRVLLPPNSCAIILFGSPRGSDWLVSGLGSGADDFWSYPLNAPVCQAYLGAILRRVSRLGTAGAAIACRDLSVVPASRQAAIKGRALPLRAKEFDLLVLLLRHQGTVVSREQLMEEAWGQEHSAASRTIDFHISSLRRKLGSYGARIKTVAKTGYLFDGA